MISTPNSSICTLYNRLLTLSGCTLQGRHLWCSWWADRSYPPPWGKHKRQLN